MIVNFCRECASESLKAHTLLKAVNRQKKNDIKSSVIIKVVYFLFSLVFLRFIHVTIRGETIIKIQFLKGFNELWPVNV